MKRWPAWLRDHWFLGMIGIVLLVLLLTVSAQIFLWASIPYRGYGASYAMIDIPEGTAAARAIEILEEHGVIQRSPLAHVYLRLTGRTHGLKAGEYSFTRPMTPGEVFDKMISGDVYYHRVTIPEGVRSDEVFAQFVRAGFGTEEDYRLVFRDTSPIADLDAEATDLEGYLFPDTYSLQKGTTPKAIVAMMVARFREVFQPSWVARVTERGLTVREATTLASMVEWETAQADENALVASVFYNRLRLGMRDRFALQHLSLLRPAARSDRQSRGGRAPGGRRARRHELPLFRLHEHRPALLLEDPQRAQPRGVGVPGPAVQAAESVALGLGSPWKLICRRRSWSVTLSEMMPRMSISPRR